MNLYSSWQGKCREKEENKNNRKNKKKQKDWKKEEKRGKENKNKRDYSERHKSFPIYSTTKWGKIKVVEYR